MPCENMYIEHNPFDSNEILHQKIGRLGRVGFSNANMVTYYVDRKLGKIKKNKKPATLVDRSYRVFGWGDSFVVQAHELPAFVDDGNIISENDLTCLDYNHIKYSKPFLRQAKKNSAQLNHLQKEIVEKGFTLLEEEAERVKDVIQQARKARGCPVHLR